MGAPANWSDEHQAHVVCSVEWLSSGTFEDDALLTPAINTPRYVYKQRRLHQIGREREARQQRRFLGTGVRSCPAWEAFSGCADRELWSACLSFGPMTSRGT